MGIKRFYGYDDDSSKLYLDKFIDFEVPLLNDKNILSKNKKSQSRIQISILLYTPCF